MNKITKILIAAMIITVVLPVIGTAEEEKVNTKFIKFVDNTNQMKILVSNIETGSFVYLENYYQLDNNGKLRYYSSRRYAANTDKIPVSFDIYRMNDRRGGSYTFVEIVLLNNKEVVYKRMFDQRLYWN